MHLSIGLGLRPQIAAEVDDMAMMRLAGARRLCARRAPADRRARRTAAPACWSRPSACPALPRRSLPVTTQRRFPNPVVRDLIETATRA